MEKYGKWTVIDDVGVQKRCRCECGTERVIARSALRAGKTRSCGCSRRKHGFADTPTMTSWTEMKRRCYAAHRKEYPNYGGRGIKVCDRWLESFSNFLADMGERPAGYTLERCDNDGDYTPDNCAWLPRAEQELNKRSNVRYPAFGEMLIIPEAVRKYGNGICLATVYNRVLQHNWDVERAVTQAIRRKSV